MTRETTSVTPPLAAAGIVRHIDHVNVATSDPGRLAALLQRILGLTAAWPLTDNGSYVTIGLMAGPSVTLAFDRSDGDVPFLVPFDRSRFSTVAFAPVPTEQAVAELDQREIPHSTPRVFPAWTNTYLTSLLSEPDMAFLCEYTTEAWFEEMKAAVVSAFRARERGPAGVDGLTEVVITTADVVSGQARWQRLLGPPTSHLTWTFENPPRLVLQAGDDERVSHLVFSVVDLGKAIDAMEASRVPIEQIESTVALDPEALDGLDIRLRESVAPMTGP